MTGDEKLWQLASVDLFMEFKTHFQALTGELSIEDTHMYKRLNDDKGERGIHKGLLDDRKDTYMSAGLQSYIFYATDAVAVANYLAALG